MVCKYCGSMLPDDAGFCGECGKPAEARTPQSGTQQFLYDKTLSRYKIATAVLGTLVVALAAALVYILTHN